MIKIKDAYYFSHDSNARHDIKIKAMINQYGMAGYGLYWVIIEMLRDTSDYELPLKKYFYQALSAEAQMQANEVEQWLRDCIDIYELFEECEDDQIFYSRSLKKRMQIKDDKRKKRSYAGKVSAQKRAESQQISTSVEQVLKSDVTKDSNGSTKGNKGKESKGKENKVKEKETTTEEKKTDLVVADDNNIFYQFQSLGFGNLTEYFKNQLEDLEKTYSAAWLIEAMQKSVEQGFYKLSYVKGILQSWKSKGKDAPKPIYKNGKEVKKDFDERPYKKQDFDDLEKKLLGW